MDLTLLGTSATFYVFTIVSVTQVLKEEVGLKGIWLKVIPLAMGVGLALGGLRESAGALFPDFPGIVATVVSGLILGASAIGSYKTVTWLQDRNATVKAQATVRAQQQAGMTPQPLPDAPPPSDAPQALPDDQAGTGDVPGFMPAPEPPLPEHANNLIASPLPRTMAILPEAPPEPLDLRFPPVPFG